MASKVIQTDLAWAISDRSNYDVNRPPVKKR